jgi:hypothetical protein
VYKKRDQTLHKPANNQNECLFPQNQIQIMYLKNDKSSYVEVYESNNLPASKILERLDQGESVFITNKTNSYTVPNLSKCGKKTNSLFMKRI